MENNREQRELEAQISILIDEQLDVTFLFQTLSNIEYYMMHVIPHCKDESLNNSYYKYLQTALKTLEFTNNQKIIKADSRVTVVYERLLSKYESECNQQGSTQRKINTKTAIS